MLQLSQSLLFIFSCAIRDSALSCNIPYDQPLGREQVALPLAVLLLLWRCFAVELVPDAGVDQLDAVCDAVVPLGSECNLIARAQSGTLAGRKLLAVQPCARRGVQILHCVLAIRVSLQLCMPVIHLHDKHSERQCRTGGTPLPICSATFCGAGQAQLVSQEY